jgi:hypothetical protein
MWGIEANSRESSGVYANSVDYAGVYAFSVNSRAVYGTSASSDAIYGYAQQNGAAIVGQSEQGPAGLFIGPVVIAGGLTVTGPKSAAVPHQDGSYRRLYSVEAPESYFEDFGSGEMRDGVARVQIEAEFAELVTTDNYYVLTPRGDSEGLYVSKKDPASFEVRESRNGKSNLAFDYRIVAKRKDIEGPRLERVTVPSAAEFERPEPPRSRRQAD